jgi:hypothetical protein
VEQEKTGEEDRLPIVARVPVAVEKTHNVSMPMMAPVPPPPSCARKRCVPGADRISQRRCCVSSGAALVSCRCVRVGDGGRKRRRRSMEFHAVEGTS